MASDSAALAEVRRARSLATEGKREEAITVAGRALELVEREFGKEHAYAAFTHDVLANLHRQLNELDEALDHGERAVTLIERAMPGTIEQAILQSNLGTIHAARGEYLEAVPLYEAAHRILEAEAGPEDPRTAEAARALGIAYLELSRPKQALAYLEQAARAWRGESRADAGRAMLDVASAHLALEDSDAANDAAQEALQLLVEADAGPALLAEAETMLARVAWHDSQLARAERLLEAALARLDPDRTPAHATPAALATKALGSVHFLRGRFIEAERVFRRALELFRRGLGPRHPAVARMLHSLALVYQGLNQCAESEQFFEQALEIQAENLGAESPASAATRVEFAATLTECGKPELGEKEARAALAVYERDENEWTLRRGYGSAALGFALHRQGRLEPAAVQFERAIGLIESERGPGSSDLPPGLTELALIRLEQGRLEEAEDLARRAIAIRERDAALTPWGLARSLTALGRILQEQARLPEALEVMRRARVVMQSRLGVAAESRSASARGETLKEREVFEHYLDVAFALHERGQQGLIDEMFEVGQFPHLTGTAAAVSRMAARFAEGKGKLAELLRERQDAVEAWQANDRLLTELLAGDGGAQREERLRAELERLDREVRQRDIELERSFPDYVILTQPTPLPAPEVRTLLGSGEALFLQLTSNDHSYVFFARPEGVRLARTPLGRDALELAVASLRAGLEIREGGADGLRRLAPFDVEAAHHLYRGLFAPFESELREVDHLFVVLDGAMQNLTPAVLLASPAPEPPASYGQFRDLKQRSFEVFRDLDFFGRRIAFSVLPSVSAAKGLRELAVAPAAPDPFVGFGDPALGGQPAPNRGISPEDLYPSGTDLDLRSLRERLGPLPASGEELRAMAAALGARENALFLGPAATEARVKSLDISGYRVIAFATHALLAGEFTGIAEPALVLTIPEEASPQEDGVLTASEVAGLRLNADWVVLSACNTAAPAGRPGAEGLSGLARAFFYAGSRALLVSHWWVDSDAAARLTSSLFSGLAERPKRARAEALRLAMNRFFDPNGPAHYSHPLYWAPFVVVGEGGAGTSG